MFKDALNLSPISREKKLVRPLTIHYITTLEGDIVYINEPQQGACGHLLSTFVLSA